ncbi:hypothetical protein IJ541_02100 [bacterium]|nr:hypothetical protein [bacterium]
MKKFLIFITIILSCQYSFAGTNSQILDKIENSLFGYTYSNEAENSRLNRIEESVYGKKSTAQTSARIAKLKKDMSADLLGQEIDPKEDTFREDEDSWVFAKEPTEASKMDYPAINELEKQVFKKEFKDQNIKTRLSNLETKTFGKTYDKDDLSTRVDRLKAEIKPNNFMSNMIAQQENDFYNGDIGKLDQNYHLPSYGDMFDYDAYNYSHNRMNYPNYSDYDDLGPHTSYSKPAKPLNISTIEKTLYRQKFENESMPQRLSRIESSVFGTTFANDSNTERIARISSAINAQKTAKRYDSNRFSQNMAIAVQIGTLILMVLACIL